MAPTVHSVGTTQFLKGIEKLYVPDPFAHEEEQLEGPDFLTLMPLCRKNEKKKTSRNINKQQEFLS